MRLFSRFRKIKISKAEALAVGLPLLNTLVEQKESWIKSLEQERYDVLVELLRSKIDEAIYE